LRSLLAVLVDDEAARFTFEIAMELAGELGGGADKRLQELGVAQVIVFDPFRFQVGRSDPDQKLFDPFRADRVLAHIAIKMIQTAALFARRHARRSDGMINVENQGARAGCRNDAPQGPIRKPGHSDVLYPVEEMPEGKGQQADGGVADHQDGALRRRAKPTDVAPDE